MPHTPARNGLTCIASYDQHIAQTDHCHIIAIPTLKTGLYQMFSTKIYDKNMADGGYFDPYHNMDTTAGLIPHIGNYRPENSENFGKFFTPSVVAFATRAVTTSPPFLAHSSRVLI
jgi:hypothetical protein